MNRKGAFPLNSRFHLCIISLEQITKRLNNLSLFVMPFACSRIISDEVTDMKRTMKTLLSAVLLLVMVFQFAGIGSAIAWADNDSPADDAAVSVVYYARRPFDLGLFDEFVAAHWPKSVIRCKGMCYFEEEYDMCYLFEQSGRQFNLRQAGQWYATMPEDELEAMKQSDATLRADWDPQYGDRMQKLVFIGQNMDRKAITDALDYCLV